MDMTGNTTLDPTVETLMTIDEVALACKVASRTVTRWTYPRGELKAVRLGRAVRYKPSELRRFLAVLEVGSTTS